MLEASLGIYGLDPHKTARQQQQMKRLDFELDNLAGCISVKRRSRRRVSRMTPKAVHIMSYVSEDEDDRLSEYPIDPNM